MYTGIAITGPKDGEKVKAPHPITRILEKPPPNPVVFEYRYCQFVSSTGEAVGLWLPSDWTSLTLIGYLVKHYMDTKWLP